MTSTQQQTDPRPLYRAALDWARRVSEAVPVERLGDSTPCAEFDVRTLMAHTVGVVGRAHAIATDGAPLARPAVVTGIADEALAATFGQAVDGLGPLWENDAVLDTLFEVPWGTVPGRGVVWAYINEALVHGWDLSVATGQDAEAEPELAEAALAAVTQFLPAQPRGGQVPFAPPVGPVPGAGPTERLANWCGHHR